MEYDAAIGNPDDIEDTFELDIAAVVLGLSRTRGRRETYARPGIRQGPARGSGPRPDHERDRRSP
jgi:hypothetical protein